MSKSKTTRAGFMNLQIHDELIFEVPNQYAASLAAIVKEIMETIVFLTVPLTVDGINWQKLGEC